SNTDCRATAVLGRNAPLEDSAPARAGFISAGYTPHCEQRGQDSKGRPDIIRALSERTVAVARRVCDRPCSLELCSRFGQVLLGRVRQTGSPRVLRPREVEKTPGERNGLFDDDVRVRRQTFR